jgi:hypothetical protein
MRTLAPDRLVAQYELLSQARQEILTRYRARAAALNRLIDIYNLQAPSCAQPHSRISIELAIERLGAIV